VGVTTSAIIAPVETNIVKCEEGEEKSEVKEAAITPKKSGALFMNESSMNHNTL
jgi:hypothetical protein